MDDHVILKPVDDPADALSEIRLTLRLTPRAKAELDWNASQLGTSMTEAIKRAVGLQRLVLEVKQQRGRILVDEPGQPLREVIII